MTPAAIHAMISANGQAVTITRKASGSYDIATGTVAITDTTQDGKGVIFPLSGLSKVPGGNVLATDSECLLSPTGIDAPQVDDVLTDVNGGKWTVVQVDTLSPVGTDLLYTLIIRGRG